MLRYALYARKSDDRREVTEKSISEQVAECRAHARAAGLLVAAVVEESRSAMRPGVRPLYSDLVRRIERGEIDALLCWKVNRLTRNMEEGGKLSQLLVDGTLKEIRTPFGTHRPGDNILPLVIETATSAQYSLDLRDNVERGLRGHFERGGWNSKARAGYVNARDPANQKVGVILPDRGDRGDRSVGGSGGDDDGDGGNAGYDGGDLYDRCDRFALLRKGWEMMLTGAYTPVQVARCLSDEWGYRSRRTEKRGGAPLSRSAAYALFRDPFYAGWVRYRGELRRGAHRPMVTDAEFARVQEILDGQSRPAGTGTGAAPPVPTAPVMATVGMPSPPGPIPATAKTAGRAPTQRAGRQTAGRVRRTFAFTGLMRCGYCGSQVTAEHHTLRPSGRAYTFYRCSNSRRTCTMKGLSGAAMEAEVLRRLESATLDPVVAAAARDDIVTHLEREGEASREAREGRAAALADLDRQSANLAMLFVRGLMTDEARYRGIEAELTERRNALLLAQGEAEDELGILRARTVAACDFLAFARGRFLSGDDAAKREIAHALCESWRLFGREKRLEAEVHPLLAEIVDFSQEARADAGSRSRERRLPRPRRAAGSDDTADRKFKDRAAHGVVGTNPFEPVRIGSGSEKTRSVRGPILAGRSDGTLVDRTKPNLASVINILRSSDFPRLELSTPRE